jgi:hypothetical protein
MEMDKRLLEMEAELRVEVGQLIDELGDVVAVVAKDYSELKPTLEANPNLLPEMVAKIVMEKAGLPKFVPEFAVKWIVNFVFGKLLKK